MSLVWPLSYAACHGLSLSPMNAVAKTATARKATHMASAMLARPMRREGEALYIISLAIPPERKIYKPKNLRPFCPDGTLRLQETQGSGRAVPFPAGRPAGHPPAAWRRRPRPCRSEAALPGEVLGAGPPTPL